MKLTLRNVFDSDTKVECLLPVVVLSLLPRADIGPNDYREDVRYVTYQRRSALEWVMTQFYKANVLYFRYCKYHIGQIEYTHDHSL